MRNKDGLTEEEFLRSYNPGDYKRPSVTTDILVLGMNEAFSSLKILLIKRGDHPFMGKWALPGGFIEENETAYQAAVRELNEETGLRAGYMDQIYTFTKPGRDPRTWVMSIAYMALVQDLKEVVGQDDAKDAAWFDLTFSDDALIFTNEEKDVTIRYDLERQTFQNGILEYTNYVPTHDSNTDALAFDHVEIVLESLQKLRTNFLYTDKMFCLAKDTFTIPELQRICEVVLNQSLYKKTFNDIVLKNPHVVSTNQTRRSQFAGGRTSNEYTYVN